MPLRSCEYASCSMPADRIVGSCMICSGHFCGKHSSYPFHTCPSEEADPDAFFTAYDPARNRLLLELLNRVNAEALIALASSLREGIPCTIPALARDSEGDLDTKLAFSQTGGQNCNLDIEFQDGVIWLVRIRLDDPLLPPKGAQEHIFLSEIFTLKFLETTRVPAPKVFHFALEGPENLVGVMFVIMEKLRGFPLAWHDATPAQRTKVMEQLADIYLEMGDHPFDSTGSLIASNGVIKVGAFAQPFLFDSPNHSLGPFTTLESSLQAMMRQQKKMISCGEISSLAVDLYLSHCWRTDMIPRAVSHCNDNKFYLKHFEDKGDHIMVDDKCNITGIIDWEFASTETKAFAFSSPCMLWPVAEFYAGDNQLSPEELEFANVFEQRGRKDMADIVRNGRKMQRFLFFNGGGVSREKEEFEALFRGLRSSWLAEEAQLDSYEAWKDMALKKLTGDEKLQRLLRESKAQSLV